MALAGVTPVSFDMSASVGSRLRHDIDFGDGTSSSGSAKPTHVYTDAGFYGSKNYLVKASVTDSAGRTNTATETITVINLRGHLGYWRRPNIGPATCCAYGQDREARSPVTTPGIPGDLAPNR